MITLSQNHIRAFDLHMETTFQAAIKNHCEQKWLDQGLEKDGQKFETFVNHWLSEADGYQLFYQRDRIIFISLVIEFSRLRVKPLDPDLEQIICYPGRTGMLRMRLLFEHLSGISRTA